MPGVDIQKLYALTQDEAENLAEELFNYDYFLRANHAINDFLANKNMDRAVRKEIFDQTIKSGSASFKRLMDLLLEQELLRGFSALAESYILLAEQNKKVVFAEIRTAFPLENNELEKIKDCLKLEMKYKIVPDPELLGGFRLKCADGRVLDASVAGRLEQLRMEMNK